MFCLFTDITNLCEPSAWWCSKTSPHLIGSVYKLSHSAWIKGHQLGSRLLECIFSLRKSEGDMSAQPVTPFIRRDVTSYKIQMAKNSENWVDCCPLRQLLFITTTPHLHAQWTWCAPRPSLQNAFVRTCIVSWTRQWKRASSSNSGGCLLEIPGQKGRVCRLMPHTLYARGVNHE